MNTVKKVFSLKSLEKFLLEMNRDNDGPRFTKKGAKRCARNFIESMLFAKLGEELPDGRYLIQIEQNSAASDTMENEPRL